MNRLDNGVTEYKYTVAVELPNELVLDTPDGRLVAAGVLESEVIGVVTDAEQSRVGLSVSMRYGRAAAGTIVIVLALLAVSIACLLGNRQIELWEQLGDAERVLLRLVIWCSYAAMVGVIARWLALAARGVPGPFYNLVEYLRRWLADMVSTALIVATVLVVARSISIQMGTITVSMAAISQELFIALAFVLGFYARRAMKMLYNISLLNFLQREESSKTKARRRNDHGKDGTRDSD